MPTVAELKDQILLDIGDSGGFIDRQINTIWAIYDTIESDYLHFLYAKRHAVHALIGDLARRALTADADEYNQLEIRRRSLNDLISTIDRDLASNPQAAGVSISFVPATFGGATTTDEYSRGTGFWR